MKTNKTRLELDHLTVVARTLEEGAAYIKRQLGIEMPAGGAHPAMGTHNRLLSLGETAFLELIAIDPDATLPNRPRWFNLDRFDGPPILSTWVLGTEDIAATLADAHPESGAVTRITRGDLNWLISIPDDGSMALGGAFPTLIEWPEGPHPASRMTDLGCRLHSLTVSHPEAESVEALIGDRIDRSCITIRVNMQVLISAEIKTPDGIKTLS